MIEKENYYFYGQTTSLCEECLLPVQAKIVVEGDCVYYLKHCSTHGYQKVLISTDFSYYRRCREQLYPSFHPQNIDKEIDKGCPYDCSCLCVEHEQHTAMAIAEVLEECNLRCPTCIASSHPGAGGVKALHDLDVMFNTLVKHEISPDLLMLSGGEPTIHPQIIEIVKLAKTKPIKHIMIISNGVRIAQDKSFVAELARLKDNLEIYLQFDSLNADTLINIRGEDLRDIRIKALENLEEAGIHSTLVCVVKNNLNQDEMSDIIDFALSRRYVRGVTFQPCKITGRSDSFDKESNYITLSEVRSKVIKSSSFFGEEDLIPHPLNPENICIGYLNKQENEIQTVTRQLFSRNNEEAEHSGSQYESSLHRMMFFLPSLNDDNFQYENLFRVAIVSFLDKFNFCTASVKRSCIHFLTPDEKIIPIDTYFLLYQNK
jgi:7,8-dihydro-6-hydroxymethylpterin dimethyltransferase